MLKQLTMNDRDPPSPPPACETTPPPPPGFDATNPAHWRKWLGYPLSDPTEEPSDLEEYENDEENKDREHEEEVEEEELEIDPDGPPYFPEGNGLDEDYISDSDGAMADCEDNIGFDKAYTSDSDHAMADCEDENLERGIISTTRDGKVATPEWYRSILT